MTAPTLPPLTGAVRDLLLPDGSFSAACHGRLGTRAPDDVTIPYAVMRVDANPAGGNGVAWRCTVQLNGCCTRPIDDVEPEDVAWNIAAHAARIFDHARNITWNTFTYSGRVQMGPIPSIDRSRGDNAPVYWAFIRAELTAHLR